MRVKVYIETSPRYGRIKKGMYYYILEYIRPDGTPVTADGYGYEESTTQDRLWIHAMIDAIKRIKPKAAATFISQNPHIYGILKEKWYERWFKEPAKTLCKNADLWSEFLTLSKDRVIDVSDEPNTYKPAMKQFIKDKEEREYK